MHQGEHIDINNPCREFRPRMEGERKMAKEITERRANQMYLDGGYDDCMSYFEFLWWLEDRGIKVIKEEGKEHDAEN